MNNALAPTAANTCTSSRENGYCEGLNSKLRDEFLDGEIFYTLKEARVLAERRRVYCNTEGQHSSLGTNRQHQRRGRWKTTRGMEKSKPLLRAPHFSTPRRRRNN